MTDPESAYLASRAAYAEAIKGLSDVDLRQELRERDVQEADVRSLVEAEIERRKAKRKGAAGG